MTKTSSAAQPPGHQNGTAKWVGALGDISLKNLTSVAVFERGKAYAAAGAVEVLSEDPLPQPVLHAQVSGTGIYATRIWVENEAVAGRCDCPHADLGWFCKHQVAVALVWRERLGGQATAVGAVTRQPEPPSAKRTRTTQDPQQALHDFLHGLDARELADKLLAFAQGDRDIARELHQWRKLREVSGAPENLKPLITEMLLPGRDFIAWGESSSYVRRAEAVLPLLRQVRERDPGVAATLGLHALRRAWLVIDQADDSDGEIGELCEAITGEWVLSLQTAGAQPAGFGDTLLQVQLEDPFASFDIAAVRTTIGAPAMRRYKRAVADRWRQAKDATLALKAEQASKSRGRKAFVSAHNQGAELKTNLWLLERLHLAQLEEAGEIAEALAVLREDLSSAQAYSQMVGFLEKHGRLREAFAQAEQGIKAFPDDWRLQEDLLRCYERDGWTREALMLRRRQFERSPDVQRYHEVLKAGQADRQDLRALRDALFDFLAARETASLARPSPWPERIVPSRRSAATGVRDVSLRAEILCSEKRWLDACALVQAPATCRHSVLAEIARHLPAEHMDRALDLLLRVFHSAMAQASTPYQNELALVGEIGRRMAPGQRAAWLAQLRTHYKAKRNFIRDLPSV